MTQPIRRKSGNTRGQLAKIRSAKTQRVPQLGGVHRAITTTFPDFRDVELMYAANGTSSSGALPYTFGNFCSGLYDPDVTGAGHQPRGYDQLCTSTGPYTRYTVTQIDIDVTFKNEAADVGLFGVSKSANAMTSGDVDDIGDIMERPEFEYRILAPSGEPGHMGTVRTTVDVAKLIGRTRQQLLSDDDYSGAYGSSPSKMVYIAMFGHNQTANSNWQYYITLRYHARLFGRAMAAQS